MTATAGIKSIDLSASSSWPVRLGASIRERDPSHAFTAVQYNYRQQTTLQDSTDIKLSANSSGNGCSARLRNGDQEYKYEGNGSVVSGTYVLVLQGQGDDAGATLERVDANYALNVIGTPTEQDARTLRKKYTQLVAQDEDEGSYTAADTIDNDDPNPDNPFDYRHYLDAELSDDASHSRPASTVDTPKTGPARSTSATVQRSDKPSASLDTTRKKRKITQDAPSASSKRTKTAASTSRPRDAQPVPSVQLSRRATLRPGDEDLLDDNDDSGELILENGDEGTSFRNSSANGQKQHSAMSMALSGQLGAGPISLRSAASSPASPFHSPAPQRHGRSGSAEDESFEIGAMSDGQEGGDEQEDGDIDDFELPSPVQDRRLQTDAAAPPPLNDDVAMDEDDDDFSKELAKAMAEDESATAQKHQSEEESEEE